jgi:hypothetical protein
MKLFRYIPFLLLGFQTAQAQMARPQTEDDYYAIRTIAIPEDVSWKWVDWLCYPTAGWVPVPAAAKFG